MRVAPRSRARRVASSTSRRPTPARMRPCSTNRPSSSQASSSHSSSTANPTRSPCCSATRTCPAVICSGGSSIASGCSASWDRYIGSCIDERRWSCSNATRSDSAAGRIVVASGCIGDMYHQSGHGAIGYGPAVRLSGRRALVTGAARGIGRAVAERLAQEGARVAVVDVDHAEPVAGGPAFVADVADERSLAAALDAAVAAFGGLDVVVANAAVQLVGEDDRADRLDLGVWQRTLDVNLTGAFLTVKHGARALLEA